MNLAIAAGIARQPQPDRLPQNIYGTEGDWETYSSPSRDARLKTAFKELRDMAERFIKMAKARDPHLHYGGKDLASDLLAIYDRGAAQCSLTYKRTDGSPVMLSYEEARRRLFLLSFDPYHCIERRWGATDAKELSTCPDGAEKQAWYAAEQKLRNQLDRTYEVEMDFSLEELKEPGPGRGVAVAPDIDVRAYLQALVPAKKPDAKPAAAAPPSPVTPREYSDTPHHGRLEAAMVIELISVRRAPRGGPRPAISHRSWQTRTRVAPRPSGPS